LSARWCGGISVAGGVLALPEVPITVVPIILDVPAVGSVEVSEEEYARLFKQLSSSDQAQIDGAIALLRAIKAARQPRMQRSRRRTTANET
jgi:hypothetical protein